MSETSKIAVAGATGRVGRHVVEILEAEGHEVVAISRSVVRNLSTYGERAAVRRLVVVSIIGADRFAGGYGAAKVAHERAALEGPIPALILRAAQFHEFVEQLVDWGRQQDGSSQVPQLGGALGVALVGTVFFGQLEAHSFTDAFEHSAPVVIGLFLAAALLSLALPRTAVSEEEAAEL
jgi:NAD dependent epimerase/dehydratase family